jgi:hypothetical protein
LQQQALEPIKQETAGGYVVPISWTQGLAKALQGGVGAYQQGALKKEAAALSDSYNTERGSALANALKAGQGSPAVPEQAPATPNDDNGNPNPMVAGQDAIAPDRRRTYEALSKSKFPDLQSMAIAELLKQDAPYSLRAGEKRFNADGTPVAENKAIQPGFSLSPGQQRFGPDGSPLAALPAAPVVMSPGQVQMGPGGQPVSQVANPNQPFNADGTPNTGYQNYEIGKAGAGASRVTTNVNSFTPASEEAQRKFMDSTRTTYDQLKQAPVALASIEQAKALIPAAKGFMGPGGETLLDAAKFLNNRVGTTINTEGVKSAEELRTRIFFNIMDNLKKMDAQPSQMQQQIMQEALGKLGTDPNALPAVLDAFASSIKGKVQLHNAEVQGAAQRGVKFPYDPTIALPQTVGQSTPSAGALSPAEQAELDALRQRFGKKP